MRNKTYLNRMNSVRSEQALRPVGAFTLIELLAVIAVIAILAGLLLNVTGGASREKNKARIKSALSELTTVIDDYHAKMGFYPPTGTGPDALDRPVLYYELVGTMFEGSTYSTLDGREKLDVANAKRFFAVDGFANSGPKQRPGKNIHPGLRKDGYIEHPAAAGQDIEALVVPVKGEDSAGNIQSFLIWKYNSRNPTNNPGRYDLWVEWRLGKREEIIGNF